MSLKALLIADKDARVPAFPSDMPTALIEVLGGSILERIIEQLKRHDVSEVVVVTDIDAQMPHIEGVRYVAAGEHDVWRAAERTCEDLEAVGVHGVIVARANHYAEIEWQVVLSHHVHFRNRATRVWYGDDGCEMYLISPGRRNEVAQVIRSKFSDSRSAGVRYAVSSTEYVNLLRDCDELRRLSKDALYGLINITPRGREIRPGVWAGEGARIEREVRLIAPAFIGAQARVHSGAVITRDSVIEHHTNVDCDTVVEDSWIQPFTALGAGIDVTNAVVDGRRLYHLARRAKFQTQDSKLLREVQESAVLRTAHAAAALMSFLPAAVMNSVRKKQVAEACGERRFEVVAGSKNRRNEYEAKLAPGLAFMRRYGNE
jgi:carbonic anhydrase/acetyltransferase-like protein (isoleucine patch superfamily)